MQVRNRRELKKTRSSLRKNMPAPELILWQRLRRKSFGMKFRRQFSIGNFIVDFYSSPIRLAIEIDGDSHFDRKSVIKGRIREKKLKQHGIQILRFTNREIMENLEGVMAKIIDYLPPLNLPLSSPKARQGEKVRWRKS